MRSTRVPPIMRRHSQAQHTCSSRSPAGSDAAPGHGDRVGGGRMGKSGGVGSERLQRFEPGIKRQSAGRRELAMRSKGESCALAASGCCT